MGGGAAGRKEMEGADKNIEGDATASNLVRDEEV